MSLRPACIVVYAKGRLSVSAAFGRQNVTREEFSELSRQERLKDPGNT